MRHVNIPWKLYNIRRMEGMEMALGCYLEMPYLPRLDRLNSAPAGLKSLTAHLLTPILLIVECVFLGRNLATLPVPIYLFTKWGATDNRTYFIQQ